MAGMDPDLYAAEAVMPPRDREYVKRKLLEFFETSVSRFFQDWAAPEDQE